jgi:aspartate carbamoyltransferase catalytic subunit
MARNLEAMNPDVIVIRHNASGAPHMLAKLVKQSIINAGDGAHEHPTQALLDMMTIKARKGRIAGLRVAIIGDIAHSRVARSNIYGLTRMGAQVTVAGPATMLPRQIEQMGVTVHQHLEEAIKDVDIIMMLRIQTEREQQNIFPSLREYSRCFCLNRKNIRLAKDDALVMHPGPINRGVEIAPDIADGPASVILEQVTNGVAVRMALLYLLTGGKS